MNDLRKRQLVQSGIFCGIIVLFFLFLSLFSVLGKKSWQGGLRAAVNDVVSSMDFTAKEFYPVGSAFSVSAACFGLEKKDSSQKDSYALIIRITTYWGPLPAVFVWQNGRVDFAGISYCASSVSRDFFDSDYDRQISYWKAKAKEIIEDATGAEKKK